VAEPYSTKRIGRGFRLDEAERLLLKEEEEEDPDWGGEGEESVLPKRRGVHQRDRRGKNKRGEQFFSFASQRVKRRRGATFSNDNQTHAG
jgi:hypothetical protein